MRTKPTLAGGLYFFISVGRKLLSERDENHTNVTACGVKLIILSEGNYSLKEMRTAPGRNLIPGAGWSRRKETTL